MKSSPVCLAGRRLEYRAYSKKFDTTLRASSLMTRDTFFLEQFAFHEAGHAVVAWRMGRTLREILASGEDGFSKDSGRIDFLLDPDTMETSEWNYVEEEVQILLAGEIADKLFFPEDNKHSDYEIAGDRIEARHFASKLFPRSASEASDWIDQMENKTKKVVDALRNSIEALAWELAAQQKLSGKEATEVIERSISGKET